MYYLSTIKLPSHLSTYTNPEFINFTTNCVEACSRFWVGDVRDWVLFFNVVLFKQWTLPQFGVTDVETLDDKTLQQRNYTQIL